jgi:hypothetical protein
VRPLAAIWIYIADSSCRDYSPLYDRICRTVAESDALLDLIETTPPEQHNPVLLLAAVHSLVLGAPGHPLAAVYAGESDADPGPLFVDLCLDRWVELRKLLATRQVNTNEVGRSALIGPALTVVAGRFGAPLGHVDVGCSAGLNVFCDRYRLDYGPAGATGPADAPVVVPCEVVGGTPPIAPVLPEVAARVGLDRDPVDLDDPDQLRWQLACVWPDTGRLPRTKLALEEARRRGGMQSVRGDAIESVGELVIGLPGDAMAVVTTTWVVGYFSPEQRAGFQAALAEVSTTRPVAWISGESPGVIDPIPLRHPPATDDFEWNVLGLVTYRDGQADPELLAYVHSHGTKLDWRARAV